MGLLFWGTPLKISFYVFLDPLIISEDGSIILALVHFFLLLINVSSSHLILASFCLDQEVARLASGNSLASLKCLHK